MRKTHIEKATVLKAMETDPLLWNMWLLCFFFLENLESFFGTHSAVEQ